MKRYYENEIKQVNDLRTGKIYLKDQPYVFFEDYDECIAIWGMAHHEDIKEDDIAVLDISDLVEGGWLNDELENTDSDFLIP